MLSTTLYIRPFRSARQPLSDALSAMKEYRKQNVLYKEPKPYTCNPVELWPPSLFPPPISNQLFLLLDLCLPLLLYLDKTVYTNPCMQTYSHVRACKRASACTQRKTCVCLKPGLNHGRNRKHLQNVLLAKVRQNSTEQDLARMYKRPGKRLQQLC